MLACFHGEHTGAIWGTRVRLLTDREREAYRIRFNGQDGRWYDAQGRRVDTRDASTAPGGRPNRRAIFVVDPIDGHVYMSKHETTGKFHHSSLLGLDPRTGFAREPATAGEIEFVDGRLQSMSNKSGHFQPTLEQQSEVAARMRACGVPPFTLLAHARTQVPLPSTTWMHGHRNHAPAGRAMTVPQPWSVMLPAPAQTRHWSDFVLNSVRRIADETAVVLHRLATNRPLALLPASQHMLFAPPLQWIHPRPPQHQRFWLPGLMPAWQPSPVHMLAAHQRLLWPLSVPRRPGQLVERTR